MDGFAPTTITMKKYRQFKTFFLFYQNVRQAQDLGLQPRHAYTISKVLQIRGTVGRARDQGIPLVRIRNPHGDHKEWRGAWSDG